MLLVHDWFARCAARCVEGWLVACWAKMLAGGVGIGRGWGTRGKTLRGALGELLACGGRCDGRPVVLASW